MKNDCRNAKSHFQMTFSLSWSSCLLKLPIPRSQRLPRRRGFLQSILQKCCLVNIFEPSVIKYGIVSNNRRSKLRAFIDCIFFFVWTENISSYQRKVHTLMKRCISRERLAEICSTKADIPKVLVLYY